MKSKGATWRRRARRNRILWLNHFEKRRYDKHGKLEIRRLKDRLHLMEQMENRP